MRAARTGAAPMMISRAVANGKASFETSLSDAASSTSRASGPQRLITALADFSSVALTQTKMAAARSVIARGNPAYLKASSAPEVFCHVDVLGPTIVSGWARNRTAPEQRVTIRLSIDDQIIQSTTADTYRADLEATLQGDGKWAFSIPFPERLPDEQMHNLELAASSGQSFKTVLKTRFQKPGHA